MVLSCLQGVMFIIRVISVISKLHLLNLLSTLVTLVPAMMLLTILDFKTWMLWNNGASFDHCDNPCVVQDGVPPVPHHVCTRCGDPLPFRQGTTPGSLIWTSVGPSMIRVQVPSTGKVLKKPGGACEETPRDWLWNKFCVDWWTTYREKCAGFRGSKWHTQ